MDRLVRQLRNVGVAGDERLPRDSSDKPKRLEELGAAPRHGRRGFRPAGTAIVRTKKDRVVELRVRDVPGLPSGSGKIRLDKPRIVREGHRRFLEAPTVGCEALWPKRPSCTAWVSGFHTTFARPVSGAFVRAGCRPSSIASRRTHADQPAVPGRYDTRRGPPAGGRCCRGRSPPAARAGSPRVAIVVGRPGCSKIKLRVTLTSGRDAADRMIPGAACRGRGTGACPPGTSGVPSGMLHRTSRLRAKRIGSDLRLAAARSRRGTPMQPSLVEERTEPCGTYPVESRKGPPAGVVAVSGHRTSSVASGCVETRCFVPNRRRWCPPPSRSSETPLVHRMRRRPRFNASEAPATLTRFSIADPRTGGGRGRVCYADRLAGDQAGSRVSRGGGSTANFLGGLTSTLGCAGGSGVVVRGPWAGGRTRRWQPIQTRLAGRPARGARGSRGAGKEIGRSSQDRGRPRSVAIVRTVGAR